MAEFNVNSVAYDVALAVEQLRRGVRTTESGERTESRERLQDVLREICDSGLAREALLVAFCGLATMTDDDPTRLTNALDLTADRMLGLVP
jgi:hypothetical protein